MTFFAHKEMSIFPNYFHKITQKKLQSQLWVFLGKCLMNLQNVLKICFHFIACRPMGNILHLKLNLQCSKLCQTISYLYM